MTLPGIKIRNLTFDKRFHIVWSISPESCLLHYRFNNFKCFVVPSSPDHSLCLQYIWKVGWFRVFGCSRLAEARCRKSLLWRHSRKQTSAYDVKAEGQENMQGENETHLIQIHASLCWILCTQTHHVTEHHLFICPCSSIFTYMILINIWTGITIQTGNTRQTGNI